MRGRSSAGLPDRRTDPGQQQKPEVGREPAQRGRTAPERRRGREYGTPAGPVREGRNRNAEGGVEQGERHAAQQAQHLVVDDELVLDGFQQHRQDRAVHDVHGIGEEQYGYDIVRIRPGGDRMPYRYRRPLRLQT